ncbi:DNA polymerase III subunit gamma/tau [Candidatus Babeliales bacterium]|nr:DNA polymerase III subunit gamma/tau [Candidatus Babeliales bacterium]
MEQSSVELNLARKWRPKGFTEIVGQSLSIRMLKNGLYLKKYFPLYIFSGQRGCGKTTTARVFAAALNCGNLEEFQKNPRENDVPCGVCESCKNMLMGRHPDFIEMDAASHTGVDNVRQILESASFVSIQGGAKIYLIDEAHMLSRAAFNAFLKVLEEPPASVFFILATTELHKIPETVRSRAFQVFFNAIESKSLNSYLSRICENENIIIDESALNIIVSESGGSARDAVNILERVRLLNGKITKSIVLSALGKISEEKLFELFNLMLEQDVIKVLKFLDSIEYEKLLPQSLWDMLINLCRGLIWIKHGATKVPYPFENSKSSLERLSSKCSINRINAIMQLFFSQEDLFLKTTRKHLFLETVLLEVCEQVNVLDLKDLLKGIKISADKEVALEQVGTDNQTSVVETPKLTPKDVWNKLQSRLVSHSDMFLVSIFNQADFLGFEDGILRLKLANNSAFFTEKLDESLADLKNTISEFFPKFEKFSCVGGDVSSKVASKSAETGSSKVATKSKIDFSDKAKWPKANLLSKHFSGKIDLLVK